MWTIIGIITTGIIMFIFGFGTALYYIKKKAESSMNDMAEEMMKGIDQEEFEGVNFDEEK